MGCWNGTCSLSNLHILSGEEIMFFFVENGDNMQGSSSCYHYEAALPICLPMIGIYNDYGSVENIRLDLAHDLNIDILKSFLKSKDYSGYDYETDGFVMGDFATHIERSIHDQSDITGVTLLMVKKTFYDRLIQVHKYENHWYGSTLQQYNKHFEEFEKGIKENRHYSNYRITRILSNYSFSNSLGRSLILFGIGSKKYIELKEHIEKFYLYDSVIGDLRKSYNAGSGSGSQNDDTTLFREFFKLGLLACADLDDR